MTTSMEPSYDVVLVGCGFGSITTLMGLRKLGLKCIILEKGASSGGIWYWNCYPGARVDSDAPIYQLFDKDIWEEFDFQERYPSWKELRRYFKFLDDKIDYSKDTRYNCAMTSARFDETAHMWSVHCSDGFCVTGRWFIPAIGFAAKTYSPTFKGMEKFKGPMHHTALWPQEGLDLKNKRVAVIGSGASGVQTVQETGPEAKQLTSYQRTPNLACPMNQHPLEQEKNRQLKRDGKFEEAFEKVWNTFAGFAYDFSEKNTFDDSPEERKAFYHKLLIEEGGFRYWLNTYKDMLFDQKANDEAYAFWRDFTRSRINDPRKKDILAPMKAPHPWGTKRPSLEQNYFEVFNLPQVDVISIAEEDDPIEEFTETGIRTKSGDFREFDVVALATGFDAVTGSLAQLDIRSPHTGESIAEHWDGRLKTHVGIGIHGFPNMFMLYGPQAPTAFSNGPTCVQLQGKWVVKTLEKLLAAKIDRFEPKADAEEKWADHSEEVWAATLFPKAKGWYNGGNIPGKKVQALNYAGGIPSYQKALDDSLENNYQGWHYHVAS